MDQTSNSCESSTETKRHALNSIDNQNHNYLNGLQLQHQHQKYNRKSTHHKIRGDIDVDSASSITETESLSGSLAELKLHRSSSRRHHNSFNAQLRRSMKQQQQQRHLHHQRAPSNFSYDESSLMSSELDTTTFFDTENEDAYSSVTESTCVSSRRYGIHRKKRLKHRIMPHEHHMLDDASDCSSVTSSTMSLNVITVCLNMDTVNFLGISIVGQSNKGGEGGIYVSQIMRGGAVALDGRIEAGDMILQVNDISFENYSTDAAVQVLREAVLKPGPIKLVVAKCWDPMPNDYFRPPHQEEPIRPIDPSAWVAHTQAMTAYQGAPHHALQQPNTRYNRARLPLANSISSFGSNSSLTNSMAESIDPRFCNDQLNLTVNTDMETLVRTMMSPDSGLDIRDRNWLKITIHNAFIGADVVDWLFNHVEGFPDRRDARKYACNLLKYGYIRHSVNKQRFSEQSYYIFGDGNGNRCGMINGDLFTLNEESEDFDSVSEFERADSIINMKPLPPPPSYMSSSGTSNGSGTTSGVVSQTEKNYQLYYPPAPQSLIGSSYSLDNSDNHTYVTSGINSNASTISFSQTQYTQYTSFTQQHIKQHQQPDRLSIKTSSDGSSGNGSDIELISKKHRSNSRSSSHKSSNSQHNQSSVSSINSLYLGQNSLLQKQAVTNATAQLQQSQISLNSTTTSSQQQQQGRSLKEVPADLRGSKQSFRMAMGNPCEFFVDVM